MTRFIFAMSCPMRDHDKDDYCGCTLSYRGRVVLRAPRPDDLLDTVTAIEELHAEDDGDVDEDEDEDDHTFLVTMASSVGEGASILRGCDDKVRGVRWLPD